MTHPSSSPPGRGWGWVMQDPASTWGTGPLQFTGVTSGTAYPTKLINEPVLRQHNWIGPRSGLLDFRGFCQKFSSK